MKMRITSILALIILFAACKKENDNGTSGLNANDEALLQRASLGNHDEIAEAQIALTQAFDDSVKAYAQRMINDHTTAQASLDSLASAVHYPIPESGDSEHTLTMQHMQALTGHSFDTAYMNLQVTDHRAIIPVFESEIRSGSNVQIETYAAQNLPVLQQHLQMADSILAHLQ
jgi:putative membrane protein